MSLLIGLYVKKALEGSDGLVVLTQGRIAPVVFPEDEEVESPRVCFYRTSYGEDGTKDGITGEPCGVAIECVAGRYEDMLMTAELVTEAIRSDLRRRGGDFSDLPFTVTDVEMSAGAEDYDALTCEYTTTVQVSFETEKNNT